MASLGESDSTDNLGITGISSGYVQTSSCIRWGKKARPHQSTPLRRSSRLMGKCQGSNAPALEEGSGQVEAMRDEEQCQQEGETKHQCTSLRRSSRLMGKCQGSDAPALEEGNAEVEAMREEEQCQQEGEAKHAQIEGKCHQEGKTKKGPQVKCDYESLRIARISENKARMASLGLNAGDLLSIFPSVKSAAGRAAPQNKPKSQCILASQRRRSERLKGISPNDSSPVSSLHVQEVPASPVRKRLFATCCEGRDRGTYYDPIVGICCHFCRQKKVCGEEDCPRCRYRDISQPCIGKTECPVCHSSNGILCRACLKVRYGEELDEVRQNKDWMCPHCIEEKGTIPFWICNSSICLKRRKLMPTGIAIFRARELGYESVAHLLMAQLKHQAGNR